MRVLLFKTPTCPNCKAAGALLDRAGVQYTALNANEERELVSQFGIKQAPTLIVPEGNGYRSFENASLIKGFIESAKIAQ
jgi:ribonucleoside-triphosphate reductase